jgi:hypothetical protein
MNLPRLWANALANWFSSLNDVWPRFTDLSEGSRVEEEIRDCVEHVQLLHQTPQVLRHTLFVLSIQ